VQPFAVPSCTWPDRARAFIVLACIFSINGMLWYNFLTTLSAQASARIKLNPLISSWLNKAAGGLFIWLGLKLALSKQN
jgi:threonine/homoserine/homoserine lactone efflux protein